MKQLPARADVVVAGSGVAGLTAALAAAEQGLAVVVLEKAEVFGGTTAYSEGMVWVPLSRQARAAGAQDSPEAALQYLECNASGFIDHERARAYIARAPEALAFVEDMAGIRYTLATSSMDYQTRSPGATHGIRSLSPMPFDGRRLGRRLDELRRPLATTMLFGGMSVAGSDLPDYFAMQRSFVAWLKVSRLVLPYLFERICGHKRGLRLTGGNALAGALLAALDKRHVGLFKNTSPTRLVTEDGRVVSVEVSDQAGTCHRIDVSHGVVLACGGFAHDHTKKLVAYPHVGRGVRHISLPPASVSGDGQRLASELGAEVSGHVAQPGAWAPVSLVPQADGSEVGFPHFMDRGKPGVIVVDQRGKRFCNEALCYHRFVMELIRPGGPVDGKAWVIADHAALRRYGLGNVPPAPGRLGRFLRSGYLVRAKNLAELARQLQVEPAGLAATVSRFNQMAVTGRDEDFQRGDEPYSRAAGDSAVKPNPTLGPLRQAPFYAIRIYPGDLGTFSGTVTNARAQVLGAGGLPIPGLYAAGSETISVTGGDYPAAGVGVGPAMTMGYIAGLELAGRNTVGG